MSKELRALVEEEEDIPVLMEEGVADRQVGYPHEAVALVGVQVVVVVWG